MGICNHLISKCEVLICKDFRVLTAMLLNVQVFVASLRDNFELITALFKDRSSIIFRVKQFEYLILKKAFRRSDAEDEGTTCFETSVTFIGRRRVTSQKT